MKYTISREEGQYRLREQGKDTVLMEGAAPEPLAAFAWTKDAGEVKFDFDLKPAEEAKAAAERKASFAREAKREAIVVRKLSDL